METSQAPNTSAIETKDTFKTWTGGYTQLPNTILKASNIDSDSKVALALLYSAYTFAKDNNQLESDGSFYYTNKQFGEHMAISGDQVGRKVIPDLLDKGLLHTIKRHANGKTRNYYILHFTTINNWDGSTPNSDEVARKTVRAKKANDGRKKQEIRIMQSFSKAVLDLVQQPMSVLEREKRYEEIAAEIVRTTRFKTQSAKNVINKMLEQYKESQNAPETKPEWLKREEEYARLDPIDLY